jgi:hypothetical protein
MGLMMCWFSLSMSPFAPGGWLDAIDFVSDAETRRQGGMGLTTSNPIAISLAISPALILGTLAFVGGAVASLYQYVSYLRTASPATKTRDRRQRRETLRKKKAGLVGLVLGIVFTLAGAGFGAWATMTLVEALASRSWPQAPGQVTESKVESWKDSEGDRSYQAVITYRYKVNGSGYTSDRISFGDHAGSGSSHAHRLVRRYTAGKAVQVYYNPDHPERSVLEPGLTPLTFLFLGLASILLLIGLLIMFIWIERFVAKCGGGDEE